MNVNWRHGIRWNSETAFVGYKRKKNIWKWKNVKRIFHAWRTAALQNLNLSDIDFIKDYFGKEYIKMEVFNVFEFADEKKEMIKLLNEMENIFLNKSTELEKLKASYK